MCVCVMVKLRIRYCSSGGCVVVGVEGCNVGLSSGIEFGGLDF